VKYVITSYGIFAILQKEGRKIIMKSTGVVRKIDELGRIVLPIELRRNFDINERDSIEIFVENDFIILKKYELSCVFCGSSENMTLFKNRNVCSKCLEEIKK
jgi:transcriptional pleiotropic regulator of transition state genes